MNVSEVEIEPDYENEKTTEKEANKEIEPITKSLEAQELKPEIESDNDEDTNEEQLNIKNDIESLKGANKATKKKWTELLKTNLEQISMLSSTEKSKIKRIIQKKELTEEDEKAIINVLNKLKSERDNGKVEQVLANLKQAAEGDDKLMPSILDAVKVYATLGEICDVLRGVFGEYQQVTTIG